MIDKPRSPFDVVILLGRGMPLGEQEKLLPQLGRKLVEAGRAARWEMAFVEVTQPSLDEVLARLEQEGVESCVVAPIIVPFDRNLRGWLGRALSASLSRKAYRMRVVLADAPDTLDALSDVAAASVESAGNRPEIREALKPLRLKPGASRIPEYRHMVNVCLGPRCAQAGGWQVFDQLKRELGAHGGPSAGDGRTLVMRTACQGPCNFAPLINVQPGGAWYGHQTRDSIAEIVARHLTAADGGALPGALRAGDRLVLPEGGLAEPDLPMSTISAGNITIRDLFLRPAMRHENAVAAFFTLETSGAHARLLTGVESALTRSSAIHDPGIGHAALQGGMGFPFRLEAASRSVFEPGRRHLMFLDIAELPDPGAKLTLTFRFSGGADLTGEAYLHPMAH